ncbi:MAG: hypothetical protein CL583_03410 [Alteromonadaceae bacterium]|nr:hypothetical protein [Alteromonadaceae bacterium]|tara:strand:- start:481 stop:834 length:354 start_codon:yes stop_codon:yes gene_type:complete
MKTIHKYRLEAYQGLNNLRLRDGFRIVRTEYLVTEKAVFLWVEEPLRADVASQQYNFRVALSGEPVPEHYCYRGTALDPFGAEAYHVFEVMEQRRENMAGGRREMEQLRRAPAVNAA